MKRLMGLLIVFALACFAASHFFTSPPRVLAEAKTGAGYVAAAKGRVDVEGGLIRAAAGREGVVVSLAVEEGTAVQAGQELAKLDDRSAVLNRSIAEGELAQAREALELASLRARSAAREDRRQRALAEDEISTGIERDAARDEAAVREHEAAQAKTAVSLAEARLKAATLELDQLVIRAPVAGRIVKRSIRIGEAVSANTPGGAFLLVPDTARIVRAELEETFLAQVKPGMKAEVVLESDDGRRFPAQLLRVGEVVGLKQLTGDDPAERPDIRAAECVLRLDTTELRVGQRVIVYFPNRSSAAPQTAPERDAS